MKLMWKHWDLSESFLSVHLLKGKCFWSSHILLKYFSLASMLGSKLETSKRLIYIFRACLSLFIPFSIIKMKMLLKIPRELLKILCILLKICYKSKLPLNNSESFFFLTFLGESFLMTGILWIFWPHMCHLVSSSLPRSINGLNFHLSL